MDVYYDPSHTAAFGGVSKLQKAARASRQKTLDFLQRSDVYTQYKPIRHRFIRRQTIAHGKNELFQADLADFQKLSRYNSGFRYVLVVIDVLSKFVFYVGVKNKKADEMRRAFTQVFKVAKPKLLQTDRGGEFTSKTMQAYFKRKNVRWYHTYSESKATLAERQIRTLKEKLQRIFHHTGSLKYVHLLSKLARAYNNTKHSRTGFKPVDINATNEQQVFHKLYGAERRTTINPTFKLEDQVRIAKTKGIFAKGHERRWTEEVFRVSRIKLTDPITYYVKDDKEEILGGFYAHELNRVKKEDQDYWDIEKVLKKRRGKDGKTEYFVKFRGYSSAHNAWVTDVKKKKKH